MQNQEILKYFTNTISGDFLQLFAGDAIAAGSTRIVCKGINNSTVIKFETCAKRFQNIMEWETWQIIKHTPFKRWFAPCIDISDNGAILIQEFCRDMELKELPEELPAFFCDIKKDNFGIYNDLVVCRDYGNSYLIDNGANKRMKKAEW